MVGLVPVLRGEDMFEKRHDAIDDRDDAIAVRYGEAAARHERRLHIDQAENCRDRVDYHGLSSRQNGRRLRSYRVKRSRRMAAMKTSRLLGFAALLAASIFALPANAVTFKWANNGDT